MRLLALVALTLASYLSWVSLRNADAMIGCGGLPAFDCRHVLTSRWSSWLGMPVSLPAVGVYVAIFAASLAIGPKAPPRAQRAAWTVLLLLTPMAAGAALWFLALLLLVVESACLYCMIIHGCGLTIAAVTLWTVWMGRVSMGRTVRPNLAHLATLSVRTGGANRGDALSPDRPIVGPARAWWLGLLGLVGTGTLIGGQLLFPPSSIRIEVVHRKHESRTAGTAATVDPSHSQSGDVLLLSPKPDSNPVDGSLVEPTPEPFAEPVPEPDAGQWQPGHVSILSGDVVLDTRDHPILGDPDARHVVVSMFDYTCRHCRKLHRHLDKARQRYGAQFAVVVLPVPMNTRCNKYVAFDHEDHRDACQYARLALAVWTIDRKDFLQLNAWLFEGHRPPPLSQATDYAARLVGRSELDSQLRGSTVKQRLLRYTGLYHQSGAGAIPKLLWNKYKITLGETSAQELFDMLERYIDVRVQGNDRLHKP